jgi:hypothetical protein
LTSLRAGLALIEQMSRYCQVALFDEQTEPDIDSEDSDSRAASKFFRPTRKLV